MEPTNRSRSPSHQETLASPAPLEEAERAQLKEQINDLHEKLALVTEELFRVKRALSEAKIALVTEQLNKTKLHPSAEKLLEAMQEELCHQRNLLLAKDERILHLEQKAEELQADVDVRDFRLRFQARVNRGVLAVRRKTGSREEEIARQKDLEDRYGVIERRGDVSPPPDTPRSDDEVSLDSSPTRSERSGSGVGGGWVGLR